MSNGGGRWCFVSPPQAKPETVKKIVRGRVGFIIYLARVTYLEINLLKEK